MAKVPDPTSSPSTGYLHRHQTPSHPHTQGRTYAKTLVPGTINVPNLVATTSEDDLVMPLLRARGWADFTQPPPALAQARLLITPEGLQLVDEATARTMIKSRCRPNRDPIRTSGP